MVSDPLLKLAISLYSSPGVYALLLGSGLSRGAGILTGWEIVLDLIRKVAKLEGEDPEPDPEKWYSQKFGKSPDYAKLLEQLAPTQAERNNLLRSYFEPTEDEREQGLKMPTMAHKAIASLVKNGYIKIILTTNFDRLLQTALELEGITPDVISTDDALKGAIPYVHSKCTIVKLNGDYRDVRIKNTPEELAQYPKELNLYLDRILDEFGLIVCGWSGQYDTALKDAILRYPSRRFTTYWASKDELNDDAKRLIDHKKGEVIHIESADKFFNEILEKVESLQEFERPHPISTAVAVATVKRYLPEEKHRIRLHDFFNDEVEHLYARLSSNEFNASPNEIKEAYLKSIFQKRICQYEAISGTLIAMLSALSYFDRGDNTSLLTRCIERFLKSPKDSGYTSLLNLQYYPALLFCYASGVAAIAASNYKNLASVLLHPMGYTRDKEVPGAKLWIPWNVFSHREDKHKWVPRKEEREYTPEHNHIFEILREPLRPYLPVDKKYEETFDIFEYLLGLTYVDLVEDVKSDHVWAPLGSLHLERQTSCRRPIGSAY